MHVLHFAESYYGGIASYLNELLPFQSAAYDRITLLIPETQRDLITPNDRQQVQTYPDTTRRFRSLLALRGHLQNHLRTNRYDIIHLHSSFAGALGRSLDTGGARIVYCPHGWANGMRAPAPARAAYALIEQVLSHRSHAIINISQSEAGHARSARVEAKKCHLIYNGIGDAPFTPLPVGAPLKRLLFVGRYDRQKGVDLLVRIAPQLHERGIALTMIGGPVIGKPTVADIPQFVDNRGWQDREVVAAAMNQADAVIMPSRWEGFGLVAVEAMRAARPVIATKVGGLAEIISDGNTGIHVEPESAKALLLGIERLSQLDIRQMGLNGRAHYEKLYTAELMFVRTDRVYRELVGVET